MMGGAAYLASTWRAVFGAHFNPWSRSQGRLRDFPRANPAVLLARRGRFHRAQRSMMWARYCRGAGKLGVEVARPSSEAYVDLSVFIQTPVDRIDAAQWPRFRFGGLLY